MSKEIMIDGQRYVPELEMADGDYVIVRSRDSGVHAGYLEKKDGNEVTLINARRIWRWSGAASLSQLALDGTSNPDGCKFPAPVPQITVLGVCEIIPLTAKAQKSIQEVEVWKK